jgi:uncharacterized protein YabE (DUF348 family)
MRQGESAADGVLPTHGIVTATPVEAPPLTRREALARERAAQAASTAIPAPEVPVAEQATPASAMETAPIAPVTDEAAVPAADRADEAGQAEAIPPRPTTDPATLTALSPAVTAEKRKPRSRVRTAQIVGQAVVITALVAGTGAFVGLSTPVDLTVDGEGSTSRTFGSTVADVLASEGIEVERGDEVSPALDTPLSRGMDITVSTSKDLTLSLDGIESEETTTAHTVGQALADMGIDARGASVSMGLDAALTDEAATALSVVTPKTVTVRADGETIPVEATAASVGEVLEHAGVEVSDTDFVTAPLGAPVVSGQNIDVMRTETTTEEVEETIKKKVEKKKTDSLVEGETKVEKKGKDGKRTVVYEVGTLDGEELTRVEKFEEILEEPVTEVVLVGTGDPNDPDSYEVPSDSGSTMTTEEIKEMLGGPGSPWYKIAKCESEFNPKAVNRQNNKYFGLFQFGIPTWQGVGGSGNPADASPQEQFQRAKVLQERYGWSQWECAGMVGVG